MKKTKLHIKGMHCVSCEMILEKEFKKISGLKHCRVNHKKGNAEIACDKYVPLSKFQKIVKQCGYEIVEAHKGKISKKEKRQKPKFFQILIIVVILAAVFWILGKLDVMRLLPDFGSDINILIALLMGIVASLSTCLALTGGIVMSFGAMVHTHEGPKNHFLARAIPHIYFHIGRIGGFIILGGLLGLLGSKINYSLTFTGYLTIFIALIMFYLGLQILNIVPNITKLGFHLPKFLSRKIDNLQKNDHHLMPIIIGILTFFLPCGFTQTMQLAAVSSQSFLIGALIMGAFAIGTLPVLIAIGIGSTYAHKDRMQFFYRFIGVLILFFALYSFNSGLVLSGSTFTIDFWKNTETATNSTITDQIQVVKMDVDWTFSPTQFQIKKGVPVRWEINGVNLSGCSNEIVIPSLGINQKLNPGLNIIEFTPEKEGPLPFSCWMGMIGGQFMVTDDLKQSDEVSTLNKDTFQSCEDDSKSCTQSSTNCVGNCLNSTPCNFDYLPHRCELEILNTNNSKIIANTDLFKNPNKAPDPPPPRRNHTLS